MWLICFRCGLVVKSEQHGHPAHRNAQITPSLSLYYMQSVQSQQQCCSWSGMMPFCCPVGCLRSRIVDTKSECTEALCAHLTATSSVSTSSSSAAFPHFHMCRCVQMKGLCSKSEFQLVTVIFEANIQISSNRVMEWWEMLRFWDVKYRFFSFIVTKCSYIGSKSSFFLALAL